MGVSAIASVGYWPGSDRAAVFFFMLLIAALVGPILLGGCCSVAKVDWQPKFSRMNPLASLKRMFPIKALVELLKALAKFSGGADLPPWRCQFCFRISDATLGPPTLYADAIRPQCTYPGKRLLLSGVLQLILIAAVGYPFQLWR